MPEQRKSGCRVEIIINCYDEQDELISDVPRGSWYGIERSEANVMVRTLSQAVSATTEAWESGRSAQQDKPGTPRR